MKKIALIALLIFIAGTITCKKAPEEPPKLFISVDMEGLAGVVSGRECSPSGSDYEFFRRIMA
jgi:D-amino peptidase